MINLCLPYQRDRDNIMPGIAKNVDSQSLSFYCFFILTWQSFLEMFLKPTIRQIKYMKNLIYAILIKDFCSTKK